MPEIPNVVGGEIVTSEWGNDIRDRTVQRYATVAARTAAHPSPVEGDLSYLQDSNTVDVYNGTAWVPVDSSSEVDGSIEVAGPLSGVVADMATVNLTIPTGWVTWKCEAYATYAYNAGSGTLNTRIRIDGTDQAVQAFGTSNTVGSGAVGGRRTGMTTTGSRPVVFRASATGTGSLFAIYLYARAVRTS